MSQNNSGLTKKRKAVKKSAVGDGRKKVKRRPVGDKPQSTKKKVSGKTAVSTRPEAGKRPRADKQDDLEKRMKKRDGGQDDFEKRMKRRDDEQDDFEKRMKRRDEERARRREARKRKVRRQKIILAVSVGVIVAAGIAAVIFSTPALKLSRSLAKGSRYTEQEDYEGAQDAYEQALKIDTASVEAYRGMADNYVAQDKIQEAKQILYTGWEKTQDGGLLHYYCVELYNEAVEEVNQKNCSLSTVDKVVQVLEIEPDNEDALQLMDTCYERLFPVTEEDEDTCMMFSDEDVAQDTCSYAEYEQLVRRILALCQANGSGEIKAILARYALIDMPYVWISVPHVESYAALLADVNASLGDAGITETMACLSRAKEVQDYFSTAFTEFESGNYAYARELVSQESYQQIRDSFIEENSGYWEGAVYIPVSREQMVLHREDGKVRFFYLDGENYDNRQGIIQVWGTKQEDDGVQRSVISYEPVAENGSNSKTEYKVQYLYSNVKIGGEYVPQMNYRFDTTITTEEGTTTNAIGDWGGEHEWEIDY